MTLIVTDPIIKDPAEILDYTRTWAIELAGDGDTIATSEWTVPEGITKVPDSEGQSATTTTVWLEDGTAGAEYEIKNKITTNAGRTFKRTVTIYVREK